MNCKALVFFAVLFVSPDCFAYCVQKGGNWYTDENPFMNVDPRQGPLDFRLQPGSCAVNRGAVIPGVTDQPDAAGRMRDRYPDIGAYEAGPQTPGGVEIIP